ncbi:MAG: glycosyltransferase [Pseudomonas sp.]
MAQAHKTLISFATRWGTKFGGINSFNCDLLGALAIFCGHQVNSICVVLGANDDDFTDAAARQVCLVSLNLPEVKDFSADLVPRVQEAILREAGEISGDVVWLGHDRITGDIALAAAAQNGGRSALIHHMSYAHYEAFAENSVSARVKEDQQQALFQRADTVMAVGPLLRDALLDLLDHEEVTMLVPGLPEIEVKPEVKNFKGMLSGRLSEDARKIKQAHLGVAAFSTAIRDADRSPHLNNVFLGRNQPSLLLRGVDFEKKDGESIAQAELDLRCFAEEHAQRAYNLKALPFTTDRKALFKDIRSASVAMMPSWHEGFGLVAWEAMAAGVPVILSDKSGAYQMLEEWQGGLYKEHVTALDVRGSNIDPFYRDDDVVSLVAKLNIVGNDSAKRRQALSLREALLAEFTWTACARQCTAALGWTITEATPAAPAIVHAEEDARQQEEAGQAPAQLDWLHCPSGLSGDVQALSNSQLLRAEAAVVPFDENCEPFLREQLDWARTRSKVPTLRLLTGAGGVGKTRLALELCQRLRNEGWVCGLMAGESDSANINRMVSQLKATERDCLLVLDYAETRQPVLLALLKALKRNPSGRAVRLLLLARDGGEWWEALPDRDAECSDLLNSPATSGPYAMPVLHDSAQGRRKAYHCALQAFARCLQVEAPAYEPDLEAEHFDRPLFIQMMALLTLRGESAISAEGLPRALLGHEIRYWRRALEAQGVFADASVKCASTLMALATLINGVATARVAEQFIQLDRDERAEYKRCFAILRPLYPDRQGLQALRPDLVGEALAAKALLADISLLDQVLTKGDTHQRRYCLTVVARLLRYREDLVPFVSEVLDKHFLRTRDDWIAVCIETRSCLPAILEAVYLQMEPIRKRKAMQALRDHLEIGMVSLLNLYSRVCEDSVEFFREKLRAKDLESARALAGALKKQSNVLRCSGDADGAMASMQAALVISRELVAKSNNAELQRELSKTLSNYSSLLVEVGIPDEAMTAAGEAYERAGLCLQLDSLAYSDVLGIYAVSLKLCGFTREAVDHAQQSLDILGAHLGKNPRADAMNKAIALARLGNCLGSDANGERAIEVAEESVQQWRLYSEISGFGECPDLPTALCNCANHLEFQGQFDTAALRAEEAMQIVSRLATSRPERFERTLADIQVNYAVILAAKGQYEQALTVLSRATQVFGKMASSKPRQFQATYEKAKLQFGLISWLANKGQAIVDAEHVLELDGCAEARGVYFYQSWLVAYQHADSKNLQAAVEKFNQLNTSEQNSWLDAYFLLGAMCEHFMGAGQSLVNMQDLKLRYRRRRTGGCPSWLSDLLQRGGIALPTVGADCVTDPDQGRCPV